MTVGITGGSGCGKTTLLDVIREQGGTVLDCDAIYHELLKNCPPMLCELEKRFPSAVRNGAVDREALAKTVFSDRSALADLNGITHRFVRAEIEKRLKDGAAFAAVDGIGIFEAGLDELCDCTVAVTAPREDRIRRLIQRDGISREQVCRRIDAQKSNEEFARLCMYTLENTGTEQQFREKCLVFLQSTGILTRIKE